MRVAVDSRCVVTRPCAGCALPWNASFTTIPSDEVGAARKNPGSSGYSNRLNPRPAAGGFAVNGRFALAYVLVSQLFSLGRAFASGSARLLSDVRGWAGGDGFPSPQRDGF